MSHCRRCGQAGRYSAWLSLEREKTRPRIGQDLGGPRTGQWFYGLADKHPPGLAAITPSHTPTPLQRSTAAATGRAQLSAVSRPSRDSRGRGGTKSGSADRSPAWHSSFFLLFGFILFFSPVDSSPRETFLRVAKLCLSFFISLFSIHCSPLCFSGLGSCLPSVPILAYPPPQPSRLLLLHHTRLAALSTLVGAEQKKKRESLALPPPALPPLRPPPEVRGLRRPPSAHKRRFAGQS